MPRGFAAIEAAAEKISRSSSQFDDSSPVLYLRLPNSGDSATVRFLEQGDDVYSFWYHDFSNVNPSQGWKVKVPCLDQDESGTPCPGCREGLPRKFQGLINMIWRGAPVFKRDTDGRVVKNGNEVVVTGNEDQVAVWRGGIELFGKVLRIKDVTYKGLTTRDFVITRDGTGLDTTYSVEPADPDAGPVEFSEEDVNLSNDKFDLEQVARFKTDEEFEEIIEENLVESGHDEEGIESFMKTAPYEGK